MHYCVITVCCVTVFNLDNFLANLRIYLSLTWFRVLEFWSAVSNLCCTYISSFEVGIIFLCSTLTFEYKSHFNFWQGAESRHRQKKNPQYVNRCLFCFTVSFLYCERDVEKFFNCSILRLQLSRKCNLLLSRRVNGFTLMSPVSKKASGHMRIREPSLHFKGIFA